MFVVFRSYIIKKAIVPIEIRLKVTLRALKYFINLIKTFSYGEYSFYSYECFILLIIFACVKLGSNMR